MAKKLVRAIVTRDRYWWSKASLKDKAGHNQIDPYAIEDVTDFVITEQRRRRAAGIWTGTKADVKTLRAAIQNIAAEAKSSIRKQGSRPPTISPPLPTTTGK